MQSRVVKKVNKGLGKLVNYSYRHDQDIAQAIQHTILTSLRNQKQILIICPDEDKRKSIEHAIQTLGAGPLMIGIDKNGSTYLDFLKDIINKLTQSPTTLPDENLEYSNYLLAKDERALKDFFQFAQEPILHFSTGTEAILYLSTLPASQELTILHKELLSFDIKGTSDEYSTFFQVISDALFLYEKEFELQDSSQYQYAQIAKRNIHFFDNYEDILFELKTILENVSELRNQYYAAFNTLYNKTLQGFTEQYEQTMDALYKLSFTCKDAIATQHNFKNKGLLSAFQVNPIKKITQNIATEYNVLINHQPFLRKTTIHHNDDYDIHELLQLINQSMDDLSKSRHAIDDLTNQISKASNHKNTNTDHFIDLESRLLSLFHKVNTIQLCEGQYELNTLNIQKQIKLIDQLHHDLDTTIHRLTQDVSYYKWLSFYQNLSSNDKKLIDVLRKVTLSDWLTLFDAWYLTTIMNIKMPTHIVINQHYWHQYIHKLEKYNDLSTQHLFNDVLKNRHAKAELLKKEYPDLYKEVNTKKVGHLYNSHILFDYLPQQIRIFFPIVIASEDDFTHFHNHGFANLIYIDAKENNVNILQDFETIHVYFSSDSTYAKAVDVTIQDNWDFGSLLLSDCSTLQRLQIVKNIATALLQWDNKPKIYHLRNSSVITFAHPHINTILEDKCRHSGIKSNLIDNSLFETIVATLMDVDKTPFLITENFLLDNTLWDEAMAQRKIIEDLHNVGIQNINIDYQELLKHGESYIHYFTEGITSLSYEKASVEIQKVKPSEIDA